MEGLVNTLQLGKNFKIILSVGHLPTPYKSKVADCPSFFSYGIGVPAGPLI